MDFTVIIPARYASERLAGKPLKDIAGKTMIERVYLSACASRAKRVIVATDNQEIAACVRSFGGQLCMTNPNHPSGTDRLAEVVQAHAMAENEIVVNVQGDEPLIPAEVINQVADNLATNSNASAATLSEPIQDLSMVNDPNVVKVVSTKIGLAMYFSRAPIPWHRDNYPATPPVSGPLAARHIGIYAYRVGLLQKFVRWQVTELERIEKLEQLRILENGHHIHVATACKNVPGGVDTAEDLQRLRDYFAMRQNQTEVGK